MFFDVPIKIENINEISNVARASLHSLNVVFNSECEYCGTLFGFKNNFLPHHITTQDFWFDVSMEF